MGIRAGRRGTLRLVKASPSAPLDDVVIRVPLPSGMAGRWLRVLGADELQVSQSVPQSRTGATAQHLLSHGTVAEAEALRLLACEAATCDMATVWLSHQCNSAVAGDA